MIHNKNKKEDMIMNKEKRNADGLTEEEFLKQYNPGDYEKPSVTVDMMILRLTKNLDKMQLLLIKRKNHPYMDCWALPGGFMEMTESAYQAACRELEEETGLTDVDLQQICTMSQPDRDPRMRVVDIAYLAILPQGYTKQASAMDDAKEALWFDLHFDNSYLTLTNEENNLHIKYRLERKAMGKSFFLIQTSLSRLNAVKISWHLIMSKSF